MKSALDQVWTALTRNIPRVLLALSLLSFSGTLTVAQIGTAPQSDPELADVANGIQLLRDKNATAARVKFSAAVRANPQSADALTWRGITENQLKQYSEAIRDFRAALRINSDEISAHYNLGLSLLRLEKNDAAIEQFRIVVAAHPGLVEPEYNLAVLLEGQYKTAEAVDHLKAAYQTQPSDIGVMQHLLVDLFLLKKTDEAQSILQSLLTSGSIEVKEQVATALIEENQFEPASSLLESVKAASRSNHEADLLLARADIGAGKYAQAVELLQPIAPDDDTGEACYLLGLAYSGAGAVLESRAAFEESIKLNPRNAQALYHLGLLEAADTGRNAEAPRHLREAVRLDPANMAFSVALGRLLLQYDQAAEVILLLQRLNGNGPAAGERDLLLGIAMISRGNIQQAIPILQRAVAEKSSLALSHNILGFCYFQQGNYSKAAEFYGKASDMQPSVLIFAHDAAIALERSSNADQAMMYALRAVSLPAAGGDDHYVLAKLLAKVGHKEDAIEELRQSISLSPDLDESYYLLARIYFQMGDVIQAAEWNAKLAELKQKQAIAYASKSVKPVSSSTLLKGAPMPSDEKDVR